MENAFIYRTVDNFVIKTCLICCPAGLAGRCVELRCPGCSRGRCWDRTFGSVLDAGSSESICQATELFKCQLAPYLAGLQALVLPGYINSWSQIFALCFEVLPFRIPERFPKCQPRPRQTYLLGRSARSPERVVEPCRKPGVDFVCPALWAVLLMPSSVRAFLDLLRVVSFCTHRGHSLFCRCSRLSIFILNTVFGSCLTSSLHFQ